jgi:hypothetical protein
VERFILLEARRYPMSTPLRHVGMWMCAAVLAACGSGTTSADPTIVSSPASTSSSSPAVSSEGPASTPTTGGADCADLAHVAATIATTVQELSARVGSEKDVAALLADVDGFAPALGGLVPTCQPSAENAMWGFLTAAEEMRQHFSSGSGKTEMSASKLALVEVRATGADLYQRLDLDGAVWAKVPASARPRCRDLEAVGARMTWDVRHLANLIGSDVVTNAEGYLVQIAGLTSAIGGLVDDCRPRAISALANFSEQVDNLANVYQAGADPAVVDADKVALGALRATGIDLYVRLGLDPSSWKVIPANER